MGGKPRIETCNGANYHVFTLGAAKCSICGWNRFLSKRYNELAMQKKRQT